MVRVSLEREEEAAPVRVSLEREEETVMVRVSPEREADTDTVRVSRVMADMEAADTEEDKILCPGRLSFTPRHHIGSKHTVPVMKPSAAALFCNMANSLSTDALPRQLQVHRQRHGDRCIPCGEEETGWSTL